MTKTVPLLASALLISGFAPVAASATPTVPAAPPDLVLDDFTTETTKVEEVSPGRYRMTSHRDPVRVKKEGDWVDIDSDLQSVDGRLAPVATTAQLTFSGGGDTRLITIGTGTEQVAVTWESVLPQPTVDGNIATYKGVRPGADLVLTSTPTGYTQSLVIHDQASAAAIVDAPVALEMSSPELKFHPGASGETVMRNSQGETVFTAAPPVMWDSEHDEASAQSPGNSEITPLDTEFEVDETQLSLTLAPPAPLVDNPGTQYPLFLDPALDKSRSHYLTVHEHQWDYYDDAAQPMRVGYCGWSTCNPATQGKSRSYFSFETYALSFDGLDPTIYDATVIVKQVHNATSNAQPVDLRRATTFSAGTNFPGTAGAQLQQKSSSAGWDDTASASLAFNNSAVKDYVQERAIAEANYIQFALVAPNENDRNQWKKFNNNPTLEVDYGYTPTTPTPLIDNLIKCAGQPAYIDGNNTQLKAFSRTGDNAKGDLNMIYRIYTSAGAFVREVSDMGNPQGTWSSATTGPLADGAYTFIVQARLADPGMPNASSAWSSHYSFSVKTSLPSNPRIYSLTNPPEAYGAARNAESYFSFEGGNGAGVAWKIDSDPVASPQNFTCSYNQMELDGKSGYTSTGGITIPAGKLSAGAHILYARSFDHTHNMAATSNKYVFQVAPEFGTSGKNLVEFEDMTATTADPEVNVYNSWTLASGGQVSRIVSNHATPTSPKTVEYKFQVPASGYQALGLRYQALPSTAKVSMSITDHMGTAEPDDDVTHQILNGQDIPDAAPLVVDTKISNPSFSTLFGFKPLSDYLPRQGLLMFAGRVYTLKVDMVGTSGTNQVLNGPGGDRTYSNYNTNGYELSLDALVVAPIRSQDFKTIDEAYDNLSRDYNSVTAPTRFDLTRTGNSSFSNAAFVSQGFGPGSTVNLGGGTFTMPAPRELAEPAVGQSKWVDNVVSMGQTIKTSQETGQRGENIYLLATSTCGEITPSIARQLTITYSLEGQLSPRDSELMVVPDWRETNGSLSEGITAKHDFTTYRSGSTTVSGSASLYVLKFPIIEPFAVDRVPVDSITLPRVGTSYNGAPCGQEGSQALHVYAISIN